MNRKEEREDSDSDEFEKDGRGVTITDKAIEVGYWRKGRPDGPFYRIEKNGSFIEGQWKMGKKHDKWFYKYLDKEDEIYQYDSGKFIWREGGSSSGRITDRNEYERKMYFAFKKSC